MKQIFPGPRPESDKPRPFLERISRIGAALIVVAAIFLLVQVLEAPPLFFAEKKFLQIIS